MKHRLFIPGPVNIDKDLKPISYFRDRNFADILLENEKLIQKAIGASTGRIIPLTCSGTGGMSAIVSNLIGRRDKVLIVDGGSFGRRWCEICHFFEIPFEKYRVPFGKNINCEKFHEILRKTKATVILMQHHETSSGQLFDVKKIGGMKSKNMLLIVDAISSFLTDPYLMDEFKVDVTLISTQKGLRLDAGMAFVILNEKSIQRLKKVRKRNYYDNFDLYLDDYNLGRGYTPFTPVVNLIYKLNRRLRNLNVAEEIDVIRSIAFRFRKSLRDLPLKHMTESPSNFLTALTLDGRQNANELYEFLKRKNIFVTQTGKQLNGYLNNADKFFRVAHIGCNHADHRELAYEMKKYFSRNGRKNPCLDSNVAY